MKNSQRQLDASASAKDENQNQQERPYDLRIGLRISKTDTIISEIECRIKVSDKLGSKNPQRSSF